MTGASSTADRIYYQGATGTTGSWITVTETAAATAGTIALSAATQSVTEAVGTVTVTATRTGGSTGIVGISYATANVTATAGSDYTATSGTLSWANGDTANKTFTVTINNDLVNEPAETFTATLSTPTGGAVLGTPATQTVTITDNDTAPTVQFVSASSSGNESTSPAAIVVSISGASGQTVTVNYATANVTATAGADYTATSGTLTWLAGDTANKTINVPILTDVITDPNETFTITLSAPVNATLGTSVHTRTITEGGGTSTIANCGGCHGYPGGSNTTFDGTRANGLFPGTHNTHVTTYNYNCSQCHRAPATTTSADFNHADGKIRLTNPINGNLNAKYGNITSWKANTTTPPFNSCSTTNCHGQLSPVWGSTASTTQCTKCHGQVNAAYLTNYTSAVIAPGGAGRDTGGKTLATDARVGAHQTHMANATISRTIRCNECHTPHATVTDATHLNRTTATVTFGAIAKSNAHTPSTTRTSGIITCNNTYCHTAKLNTGAAMAPTWNATGYLSGSMTVTDCKQCHGMPPTPLAVGSAHESVAAISAFPATTCGCHANLKSDGTTYATIFVDKAIHVDGTIDVSACDSCHGFPPTSGAHTKHINKIMAIKGLGAIPAGFVNNQVCGACHNDTSTTKHAGNTPNDGTTRNIYLPTATAYQLTYQFGASAPSYDKAGTTTCSNISCHLGTSTAWGTTAVSCNGCHGYPPVTTVDPTDNKHAGTLPVNHIGVGASVNTKATFVSQHGGCRICHGTQDSGTGTHSAHVNYDPVTQHATGSMNMNGPATAPSTNSTQYDSTIRGCLNACHASTAPYRMTASSLTLAYGSYGAGGDCVSCHAVAQGTRAAVSTEFGLAWGHKKSGRGAVTKADCIVCHLEGDFTTQGIDSAYHLGVPNGNIDLRDPDGAGKTPITNNSGGAFTFTKYAISYAAGSRTTTLGNTIPEVITVKFCMKCHDSNGATNPTALTRNATNTATTGTAMMPFGGLNLGANYTVVNGAAAAGGLVNVASQFAAANSSRHPVGAPNSRAYPYSTKLVAPYNGIGTTRDANTLAGNTASPRVKANSVILVCDDCHTTGTTVTTRMITSHGNAASLRGTYYATGPTLCTTCHIGTYNDTANGRHNTGSAFSVGTTRAASALNNCEACHFSKISAATAVRPIKASDIHGFNNILGGAAWTYGAANGMRPIAFLRNTASFTTTSPRPYTATVAGPGQFNLAAGQSTCGGSGTIVFCNGNDNHTNYSPGGSY